MALFNLNCFMNFNFAQPNFSFGCFTMPNFFSNFSLFNFGCNGFNQFSFMNQYPNVGIMNSPSIFTNFTPTNFAPTTFSFPDTPYVLNSSTSIFNTPSWDSSYTLSITSPTNTFTSNSFSSTSHAANKTYNSKFATMSKSEAVNAAEANPNLEKLSGGNGWRISSNSFVNDIPYARKGMNAFLTKLSSQIGENLVVTSALGTATSPHSKNGGHYDETNPKLDFGGGMSESEAYLLKAKLDGTGYFSRVEVEVDGTTAHLDVKVKENELAKYESIT